MLFSSVTFLYYFLPITLLLYFVTPMPGGSLKYRNRVLLAASLVFYAWTGPGYAILVAAQCVVAWLLGLLIFKYHKKSLLAIAVVVSMAALLFYKYADFFLKNINSLFHSGIPLLALVLPIGISFYTFKIISYLVDIYKGKVEPARNILDFSVYIVMFANLLAGPIVRYADSVDELHHRKHSMAQFAQGVRRFTLGLAKKVLVANVVSQLIAVYKASSEHDVLYVWMYLLAYSIFIYFDFSGYTDMAIGLGNMLGFRFAENFNYPFTADSITNFWRRWHMTLTGWFRDYVYIPLGGNRVPVWRHILNIAIVWMLTGFWHGSDWNFILWGLYFGIVMLLEKFFLAKFFAKIPKVFSHIYVVLILFVSWTFFDSTGFRQIGSTLAHMFGAGGGGLAGPESLYYLRSYMIPLIIGVIGFTQLPKLLANKISVNKKLFTVLEPVVLAVLFVVSTAFLIDGSFNPFIYFAF